MASALSQLVLLPPDGAVSKVPYMSCKSPRPAHSNPHLGVAEHLPEIAVEVGGLVAVQGEQVAEGIAVGQEHEHLLEKAGLLEAPPQDPSLTTNSPICLTASPQGHQP